MKAIVNILEKSDSDSVAIISTPSINEPITQGDVRKMIAALKEDVETYNDPVYESNPHITTVRTTLTAVIYALKKGLLQ
ncbi:hypothetical protein LCGC14_1758890 [marine sediment metagenome]|uniref:Uncharacterized protein n=1 Tax=marine sediment metagenome TaxID=412755 RepID=A0A0F9K1A3_9ZZZZ